MVKTHFTKFAFSALLLVFAATANGQKMTAAEIVAGHLNSIGSPEARAAAKTRILQGSVQARSVQISSSLVKGKMMLASDADKSVLQMSFNLIDYTRENINFDGKNVNAAFVNSDRRSALGDFVYGYKEILKYGFFGGTLVSSWALLNADKKVNKITYEGKEKIGDRDVYILRCVPTNGSELNIKLYFDAENFRHLRTRYYLVNNRNLLLSSEVSSRQGESRYLMIEDFSGFKSVNELTLPTTYKITYTLESYDNAKEFEWVLNFSRFAFNSPLKPELFEFK